MHEALLPEVGRRCGNPECNGDLSERRGTRAQYCSVTCRSKARDLRRAELCKGLTEKLCTGCSEVKDVSAFTRPTAPYCQPCARAKRRESYRSSGGREKVYAKNLQNNYGMTLEKYEQLVAKQEGRCAICKAEPDHRLHVDHNHTSGAVRDLLCRPCNYALGHAEDDPKRLRAMADYLERHQ